MVSWETESRANVGDLGRNDDREILDNGGDDTECTEDKLVDDEEGNTEEGKEEEENGEDDEDDCEEDVEEEKGENGEENGEEKGDEAEEGEESEEENGDELGPKSEKGSANCSEVSSSFDLGANPVTVINTFFSVIVGHARGVKSILIDLVISRLDVSTKLSEINASNTHGSIKRIRVF